MTSKTAYSRLRATVELYEALSAQDIDTWRALCRAHQDYDSALLTPEFASIISSVRDDVRIVRIHEADVVKAVLPVHLRPNDFARPLGMPFADYSGPVVAEGFPLTVKEMLQLAGIAAFSSSSVPDPWKYSPSSEDKAGESGEIDSHIVRLAGQTSQDLFEQQRSAHPKRFKNFRRLRNQLEREAGALEFEWGRPNEQRLETLLRFKSAQFRQSGYVDLTNATKAREILDAVARSPYSFMTSLRVGDTLISGHFGVRVGGSFHPWIAAFNPAFGHFSPGNILLMYVLDHMSDMSLNVYDLANGHDHYKKYFSNACRTARPVFETGSGLQAFQHRASRTAWQLAGADAPSSITGRLQRRMDQIAVSEFGALSRLKEFAYALKTRSIPPKGN